MRSLLSKGVSNAKTIKNALPTHILYLSPFTLNSSGINVCPKASAGCVASCLFTAGLSGVYPSIQKARIAKTDYYLKDRTAFCHRLYKELERISKKGIKTAIRLNGTSDLDFVAIIKSRIGKDILALPNLVFYDYTKILGKALKYKDVSNYKITFSLSEVNQREARIALMEGINVSAVFRTAKFPSTYLGYPVVNGDSSDDLMLNQSGVILGLKAKGKAKKDKTGFVID